MDTDIHNIMTVEYYFYVTHDRQYFEKYQILVSTRCGFVIDSNHAFTWD